MRFCLFFIAAAYLLAEPAPRRHLFRTNGALTEATGSDPEQVATGFLAQLSKAQARDGQASAAQLGSLYVAKRYRTEHNGVTHLLYRQRYQGLDVFDSDITVNLDREGRILNLGGDLAPAPEANAKAARMSDSTALLRAAFHDIDPERAPALTPLGRSKNGRLVSFGRGPAAREEVAGEPGWAAINGRLRPAWRFFIPDDNGQDFYSAVVETETQAVLSRRNLTRYQRAPRARVFTGESPTPNPTPGRMSTTPYPYVNRTEVDLAPTNTTASPRGWVNGGITSGNNAHAVYNPLLILFDPSAPPTSAGGDGNFLFPLEIGPGQPAPTAYKDAAVTNLFYWVNRTHDLFYAIGFDEAAGNYQRENFGRGGVGGDALVANAQCGSQSATLASLNNAFYTNRGDDDGTPSTICMYVAQDSNTGVFTDGSYDTTVIIHEYTHGVSGRLVPQLFGFQGGAMGEAWSDYYGLEFVTPEGAPLDGSYGLAEYLFFAYGTGLRSRPVSTNFDVNPLTYATLGSVSSFPGVHADGEIWMQALWDLRANLIRQFGEREGRRRANTLILDGMKLSPPNPTMVDARDAILLADRVGFAGASQDQLWTAFAKRGLGALALSTSPDSLHIAASYEKPSAKAKLAFYEDKLIHGEPVRVNLSDLNNTADSAIIQLTSSSGDVETVPLQRYGSVFTGGIFSTAANTAVANENGALTTLPGDAVSAYYVDYDTGSGSELIQTTVSTTQDYALFINSNPYPVTAGQETMIFPRATTRRSLGSALVTLPFAFPFYNKSYRTLRVYGNGLITFGLPNISQCTDEPSFQAVTGIAPLWMELMYLASAQREENVFLTRGAGSITFRWAAQTQRLLVGQTPDPVNFAVTLYDDGRITVNYGDGNQNLTNSQLAASVFGCQTTTPTVGLSAGHEFHANIPTFLHGRSRLDRTYVRFSQPFGQESIPQIRIEAPVAGATATGQLTVTGVTWDTSDAILRTDVYIDGTAVGRIGNNVARPDFCAAQAVAGCPNIGFNARFDLGTLRIAPGQHTLQIRVTNARGAIGISPEVAFTSVAAPATSLAQGAVETPAEGATVNYPLTFRGWVHSGSTRVLAVDALIDGITVGPAGYGQARADVCAGLSPAPVNCPGIGVTFGIGSPATANVPLAPGRHYIQWRVRDEFGRVSIVPATPVNFTIPGQANKPPVGVVENPKPNEVLRGTVRITGYGYDPDGRVLGARLLIGSFGVNLTYGVARADACAGLTGVERCPNIGFEGTFDTRLLPNGLYNLSVLLFDDYGAVVTIPALGAEGMNVRVEN